MSQLSANTCNIVTIFPLGVICNPTDAFKPNTPNGSIQLNISGGTPPYTTSWSNGQQGNNITNLLPGIYTATTTDYPWPITASTDPLQVIYVPDYTAVTLCEVGFQFFDLDVFENCSNSGEYIYYLSQYPSIFTSGKVYTLSGQSGCWESSGTTTYTNQTYINNFAQITSGPFDNCSTCLPTPTPTPIIPQYICLSKNGGVFEQYQFETGSTINGYPSWNASAQGYTMYFNTGTTQWEMSGWTTGTPPQTGQLVRNSVVTPPIGTWSQQGTSVTWTSVTGTCAGQPLEMTLSLSQPSCAGQSNGVITITAVGGSAPYTYSLNGLTYQSSPIFGSQNAGAGTAFVKDSLNNIVSTPYVLVNSSVGQTYVLTLNQSTPTPTTTSTSSLKDMLVNISVSPSLAPTETLSFQMVISDNRLHRSNGDLDPTVSTSIPNSGQLNPTGGAGVGTVNLGTFTGTSTARPCGGDQYTSGRTATYNLTITGSGGFSFTISSNIITPLSIVPGCALFGSTSNQVSLTNISLSTPLCNNINTSVPSVSLTNLKQGLISTSGGL
jgi:hypothetical protein